ncbi:CDP-glucose 4,6-dehydratase [Azospira oryzae PS]|uniref:CDP-glucose 4,6-dehydratase n=1 Tax=Azospira oryzae (strain ATCC BAA-33 / DSM 13638 / PS) TaxID=640081 RepID=G8QLG7_AZOOP|nr:CDP-glucose 4,6-dehydratase [Azospira oryzae]AEV24496.1 CDP-glucose 4,6-dehydratase [Azospira oryzae PS]
MNRGFWSGKRVFLTGHTGFKGGWLALWLADMGAEVHGYALNPPTSPALFNVAGVGDRMASSVIADVRDGERLARAVADVAPEVVFHLAAQPLVRHSYKAPVETYAVNVMGTINLLEAVRHCASVKVLVNVTTDKCYENREWVWAYREHEAMGGHDPYSSSKACSELVTASYRNSFLAQRQVQVATARAGNVIGGGDWAEDRLLPDFLRALDAGRELVIRSPAAIRPWQHVLEPLSGYLTLAEQLQQQGPALAEGWNFGPNEIDARPVRWIVDFLCQRTPGAAWRCDEAAQPHEAGSLKLDSAKAKALLGWRPRWNLAKALEMTIDWHQAWKGSGDMAAHTLAQIRQYEMSALSS